MKKEAKGQEEDILEEGNVSAVDVDVQFEGSFGKVDNGKCTSDRKDSTTLAECLQMSQMLTDPVRTTAVFVSEPEGFENQQEISAADQFQLVDLRYGNLACPDEYTSADAAVYSQSCTGKQTSLIHAI